MAISNFLQYVANTSFHCRVLLAPLTEISIPRKPEDDEELRFRKRRCIKKPIASMLRTKLHRNCASPPSSPHCATDPKLKVHAAVKKDLTVDEGIFDTEEYPDDPCRLKD